MQRKQYFQEVVSPFLEAMEGIESGRIDKAGCEDLLLALGRAPLGLFEGDLERLWMQALAAFRYAAILWLYGDFRAAREECTVARGKLGLIEARSRSAWPVEPRAHRPRPAQAVAH